MKKKRIMTWPEFMDRFARGDDGYYAFSKISGDKKKKAFYGGNGTLFVLGGRVTDEEKKELMGKYNNIRFFKERSQYAPEIGHDVVFRSTKPLKIVKQRKDGHGK